MTTRNYRVRHAIRLAILVGTGSAAFASQSPTLVFGPKTPLCYCKCEHGTGKQCTKMCELPKYQNRRWATSCHKKGAAENVPSAPGSNSRSHKTNRTEEA